MSSPKVSMNFAEALALSMYENEPCRICGKTIDDAKLAVFAGYSKDDKSRSSHKTCWLSNTPKAKWVYSED